MLYKCFDAVCKPKLAAGAENLFVCCALSLLEMLYARIVALFRCFANLLIAPGARLPATDTFADKQNAPRIYMLRAFEGCENSRTLNAFSSQK